MKILNFLKNNWSVILFLIINFYIHKEWLFSNSYLTSGDSKVYLNYKSAELVSDSLNVFDTKSLGNFDLTMSNKPLVFLHGFFYSFFGLDYPESFKIIYILPILLFGPLGIYIFFRRTLKFSNSTIFVLFFLFFYNSYFIALQTGHLMIAAALSFVGFCLYLFHKFLYKFEFKYINFLLFFLFLVSFYDIRILLIYILMFAVVLLYMLSQAELRENLNFKLIFLNFIYLFTVLFLLNFYWIYTTFNSEKLFSNSILDRSLFGNEFFSLIYSLTLNHSMWDGSKFVPFSAQDINPLSFVVIIVSIISFLIIKNKSVKEYYAYFIILILGILLTKQSDFPFPQLYKYLFENIPGFKLYREASKFYILLMVGYSVVIGYFLEYLQNKKFLKFYYILCLLLIFNFSETAIGITNKTVKEMFVQREIPNSYSILNENLNSNSEFGRVLWVPAKSRWGLETNLRPGLEYITLGDLKTLVGYRDKVLNFSQFQDERELENYFKFLSIKYIVITRIDNDFRDEDYFYNYYSGNSSYVNSEVVRNSFINQFSKISFFSNVDLGTREIYLFENKSKTSLFYEIKSETLTPLNFMSYSNTKKSLDLKLNSNVKNIIFSTNFDSNWKFFITKTVDNKVNLNSECKLQTKNVSLSKYGLIEIKLDKSDIQSLPDSCFEILDNNEISFRLIANYLPQESFSSGLYLSLTFFILLILLIFYSLVKKIFKY